MCVEFAVDSLPCVEGFSPGSPDFLPSTKINIPKFQLDSVDEESLCLLVCLLNYLLKIVLLSFCLTLRKSTLTNPAFFIRSQTFATKDFVSIFFNIQNVAFQRNSNQFFFKE
jgi:hypothetical protein